MGDRRSSRHSHLHAERATTDLDVVILNDDSGRAELLLTQAGFTKGAPLPIGSWSWRSREGVPVDTIYVSGGWWPEALDAATGNRDVSGAPVLPLPFLSLMKLESGRAQDVADVSRMLGVADEAALTQVRDAVRRYAPDLLEDVESLIALGKLEHEGPAAE